MNKKLQRVLDRPIKTILDVRDCFNSCSTQSDIATVIKKIPPKFGEFVLLIVSEQEDYFMIQNFFERQDGRKSQTVTYNFYREED